MHEKRGMTRERMSEGFENQLDGRLIGVNGRIGIGIDPLEVNGPLFCSGL